VKLYNELLAIEALDQKQVFYVGKSRPAGAPCTLRDQLAVAWCQYTYVIKHEYGLSPTSFRITNTNTNQSRTCDAAELVEWARERLVGDRAAGWWGK